ncbi:lysine--tRNA ligase [Acidocella aminolytica]|jgi:lysyl-tRNA synthetase class 1|uniref:Lysine--tRNA ligase n=1 Tax=Acidocella aminolytica 101 = DSM 11237 TaxID=1120923 RepID=A0A0D6PGQ1_9PROT|nr:lysine--tRNA ligase [Acidocella aminolytica]GAN80827.1 lysyl-tRNA synthetase [Acidocella aminolytica 101 = DSM 11237]GBQ36329.1 lysyl-tRNA synthetase [Acidocella aminolytica 101 = DSM 11237]SHE32435.1 lysyl-tRNA synthetase, class I [Acidocella aminolytica 101 = DSM 11237]
MSDNTSTSQPSWPFREAERIAERLKQKGKTEALFETGYGPSGLPHIGTFGEVARTSWVRKAFTDLTGLKSRLLAFSDDMDGLRKVPDNVPNKEMLRQHLGKPLTRIPDPFGKFDSFGAHNNNMLQDFLRAFGFEFEFASASDYYESGRFDDALLHVLRHHEEIVEIILPTLGKERQATYSPILPIHPRTGIVMQVPIDKVDADHGTVFWMDPESGIKLETSVLGGNAKLQWKADWAMRWYALDVDYEMSGKDLIDSVKLSSSICRALGKEPPVTLTYELFLDEKGQKISKSKGNGLSIEQWLTYAPKESLAQFMYHAPQRAKRLFFDVIPRSTDDYINNVASLPTAADKKVNPAWHIHGGELPEHAGSPISFTMLLNLASVSNADNAEMLWGFIRAYMPEADAENYPFLAELVHYAVAYNRDFVAPKRHYRAPTDVERAALEDLANGLRVGEQAAYPGETEAERLQNLVYAIGKRHPFSPLKAWFDCLYQVLLGTQEGPRFGGFIALYGVKRTIALIETSLARQEAAA